MQSTNFVKPTVTWLAATSTCDLIIVSSTVFYLLKSRKPEFKNTNAILARIIKITVETGLLCALFAIVDLCLFVTYTETNYHLALCTALSKVYSNSILLILNSRAQIGHGMSPGDNISAIVFRNSTRIPVDMSHSLRDSTPRMDSEGHERKMGE